MRVSRSCRFLGLPKILLEITVKSNLKLETNSYILLIFNLGDKVGENP